MIDPSSIFVCLVLVATGIRSSGGGMAQSACFADERGQSSCSYVYPFLSSMFLDTADTKASLSQHNEAKKVKSKKHGKRYMPPTPMLPEAELYTTKVKLLSKDDPYIAQPVVRLPYKNITYDKDSKGNFKKVGSGSYAKVYKAKLRYGNEEKDVVVKLFKKFKPKQPIHEVRLLGYLDDTGLFPETYGIVRSDVDQERPNWALVQEYYADGLTMWDLIHEESFNNVLKWLDILIYVAKGLKRIHNKEVLFNDFKSNNMLAKEENGTYIVKFIDVGSATYRKGHEYAVSDEEERKDLLFLSPEAHDGNETTLASDVYSLCYLISEVAENADVYPVQKLAQHCLQPEAAKRPSMDEVIKQLERKIVEAEKQFKGYFPLSPAVPEVIPPKSKVYTTDPNDPFLSTPVVRLPYDSVRFKKSGPKGKLEIVGTGNFATVYRAVLVLDGVKHDVVAKVLKKVRPKQIVHEYKMLKYLEDTGAFPKTYGIVRTDVDGLDHWAFVQEYYGRGQTVWELLKQRDFFSPVHWVEMCLDMAVGVKKMHEKNVLFNDIKTDNMLVVETDDGMYENLKYVDVGHASYKGGFEYAESTEEERESMSFLSPEAHDGIVTTAASDIYSLGFAIYEVFDYAAMANLEGLANSCMEPDPTDRPTIEVVIAALQVILSDVKRGLDIYPPSPNVPEPPFYESKANIDDDSDPYITAQIIRLSNTSVILERDEDGRVEEVREGSFSKVFKGKLKLGDNDEREVAVKMCKHPKYKQIAHEARLLTILNDTGLFPQVYGIARNNATGYTDWALVIDYFSEGDTLWDYLHNASAFEKQATNLEMLNISLELAKGMQVVHEKYVLFNDYKTNNILFDYDSKQDKFIWKYIDLGLASYKQGFEYAESTPQERKSLVHLSPEAHDGIRTSEASDIYSLGYALESIGLTIKEPRLTRLGQECMLPMPEERHDLTAIIQELEGQVKDKRKKLKLN